VKSQNETLRAQVLSLLAECQRKQIDTIAGMLQGGPDPNLPGLSAEQYETDVRRLASVGNEALLGASDGFVKNPRLTKIRNPTNQRGSGMLSRESVRYIQSGGKKGGRIKHRFSTRYTSSRMVGPDTFKRAQEILAATQQQKPGSKIAQKSPGLPRTGMIRKPRHSMRVHKEIHSSSTKSSLPSPCQSQPPLAEMAAKGGKISPDSNEDMIGLDSDEKATNSVVTEQSVPSCCQRAMQWMKASFKEDDSISSSRTVVPIPLPGRNKPAQTTGY
jgi:hypothetical protein